MMPCPVSKYVSLNLSESSEDSSPEGSLPENKANVPSTEGSSLKTNSVKLCNKSELSLFGFSHHASNNDFTSAPKEKEMAGDKEDNRLHCSTVKIGKSCEGSDAEEDVDWQSLNETFSALSVSGSPSMNEVFLRTESANIIYGPSEEGLLSNENSAALVNEQELQDKDGVDGNNVNERFRVTSDTSSSSGDDAAYYNFIKEMESLRTPVRRSLKPSLDYDFIVPDDAPIIYVSSDEDHSGSDGSGSFKDVFAEDSCNDSSIGESAVVRSGTPTSDDSFAEIRLHQERVNAVMMKKREHSADTEFLRALSNPNIKDFKYSKYVRKFNRFKEALVRRLFRVFNRRIFSNQLPEDMKITWNKRLLTTAGLCKYRLQTKADCSAARIATIELSTKVCDSAARCRDTLAHELCHAAVFIINRVRAHGHGPVWKHWADKVNNVFPSIPKLTRCHSYEIMKKYVYKCTGCNNEIRRFTKSLRIDKFVCSKCKSSFRLYDAKNGKEITQLGRPITKFALFVQQNYRSYRTRYGYTHVETMAMLARHFKEQSGS